MSSHPNSTHPLAIAARFLADGTAYALVTVVRVQAPASARPGDKAIVTGDGVFHGWVGGGCAQPAVVKTVRQSLADGRTRLIRIAPASDGARELGDVLEFGMSCHSGGALELLVDPVLPQPRLLILGISPVAATLAQLAPRVGFAVTVAAVGARPGDFPDAQVVLDSDAADQLAERVPAGAYVVVATQGRRDLQALQAALAVRAQQVSLVASARKASVLKTSLLAGGADADAVAAIAAPAGYPIAASTPEEIALSVLAAIVAQRRGVHGSVSPAAQASSRGAVSAVAQPALAAITDETTPGSCCGH